MIAGMFQFRSHQCSGSRSYTLPASFTPKQTISHFIVTENATKMGRTKNTSRKMSLQPLASSINQSEKDFENPQNQGVLNKQLMGWVQFRPQGLFVHRSSYLNGLGQNSALKTKNGIYWRPIFSHSMGWIC